MKKKKKAKELTVGINSTTSVSTTLQPVRETGNISKECAGERMRKRCKSGGLRYDELKRIYKSAVIDRNCVDKYDKSYVDVKENFSSELEKAKAKMTEYELLIVRTRATKIPNSREITLKRVKLGVVFRFVDDGKKYIRRDYNPERKMYRYCEVGTENICRYADGNSIVIIN